jgi:hypothetical protein
MFLKILLAIVVLVVVFVVIVAMRPSEFRVARSTTIEAPPEAVFVEVNDFHGWEAWSPWLELDPNAKTTYEGPTAGTGATFRWAGNKDVGEGSMTITESRPYDAIGIRLDFIKPFAGTSDVEFKFEPRGDHTAVTWAMSGQNNFLAKAMGLFINCDKMIGDKYEEGLANLKSVVESKRQPLNTGAAESAT